MNHTVTALQRQARGGGLQQSADPGLQEAARSPPQAELKEALTLSYSQEDPQGSSQAADDIGFGPFGQVTSLLTYPFFSLFHQGMSFSSRPHN